MSNLEKAERFIAIAEEAGWQTKWTRAADWIWIKVVATRGAEWLQIEWQNNQLSYSPMYRFHEMDRKIHSRLDAERVLQATKPDIAAYQRWQRANRNTAPVAAATQPESELPHDYMLPFDIHEDPDSVILKAIRGNTLLWKNEFTKEVDSVWVPWRVSDGKRLRVYNADTENVFYLAGSSTGRDYVSFMDANGKFRAVHLDAIIGVV